MKSAIDLAMGNYPPPTNKATTQAAQQPPTPNRFAVPTAGKPDYHYAPGKDQFEVKQCERAKTTTPLKFPFLENSKLPFGFSS